MTIKIITLAKAKRALAVEHAYRDSYIEDIRLSVDSEIEVYLDKVLFSDQRALDSALVSNPATATIERSVVVNKDIQNAACLLVQYYYYGVSAFGADKIEKAAHKILNKYRLTTA